MNFASAGCADGETDSAPPCLLQQLAASPANETTEVASCRLLAVPDPSTRCSSAWRSRCAIWMWRRRLLARQALAGDPAAKAAGS